MSEYNGIPYNHQGNIGDRIHLSWHDDSNSGMIFNKTYHWGPLYYGVDLKPDIGIDYLNFNYSEVFIDSYSNLLVLNDGTHTTLSAEQISKIKKLAMNWVQPVGQEGNLDSEQLEIEKKANARAALEATALLVMPDIGHILTDTDIKQAKTYRKQLMEVLSDPIKEFPEPNVQMKKVLRKCGMDDPTGSDPVIG